VNDGCTTSIGQIDVDMTLSGQPDAGVPDAPPVVPDAAPDATVGGPDAGITVTGSRIDTYVTATGNVNVPRDLRSTTVQALVQSGQSFQTFAGRGNADGSFSIGGLPLGTRYIRVGNVYLVTSSTAVDFGDNFLGRPNLREVGDDVARFSVDVDNAELVEEFDFFELYSLNLNLLLFLEEDVGEIAYADTLWVRWAIEHLMGDRVDLTQMALQETPAGETYRSVVRAHPFEPFSTVDNVTQVTQPASFLVVPQDRTVTLDWRRTQFQNTRALVNPDAVFELDELAFAAVPGRPLLDLRNANTPDMFYTAYSSARDVNYGSISFGDPFVATWERWAQHRTTFSVEYTAPGADDPVQFFSRVQREQMLAPTMTIVPGMTPARAPRIEGIDAFMSRSGVALMPQISWTAPATGTAQYAVFIYELSRMGTGSRFDLVASIHTRGLSIRVPPGVLQDGHAYFVQIKSYAVPSASPDRPFKLGLPSAEADVLTAAFIVGGGA
jgi:hypothetical protein